MTIDPKEVVDLSIRCKGSRMDVTRWLLEAASEVTKRESGRTTTPTCTFEFTPDGTQPIVAPVTELPWEARTLLINRLVDSTIAARAKYNGGTEQDKTDATTIIRVNALLARELDLFARYESIVIKRMEHALMAQASQDPRS